MPKGRGKPKVKPPRAKGGDPERQALLLEIKAEAERAGIDPRQEHDRRFPDKPPTLELLQQWLAELKALPIADDPEIPQEIRTWGKFWTAAAAITDKTPDKIAGMLGVEHMEDWTETLDEALEQLRKLCGKKDK
ncbi:MAG: hypothetical protein DDT33_01766 [Firmicutes bacterium]|nr:hypothetical protein [Bacillota bacterium]